MNENRICFSDVLEEKISAVQAALSHTADLRCKVFYVSSKQCAILYLHPICDRTKIREVILKPLLEISEEGLRRYLSVMEGEQTVLLEEGIIQLLHGNCLFFLEGEPIAYVMETAMDKERALTVPINERVIRGSHLAFNENLETSLYLIRKQLEHKQVIVKLHTLGSVTHTRIAVVYLNEIANPAVVERVENRLKAISAEFVQTPGFIEEMIEDQPLSPFPQIMYTERPDRAAAYLNEGSISACL